MVFNTATIGTAVAPAVVGTFFSHYLNPSPRADKPTADISYDEGLNLIRKFLLHVSHHTVEDIQGFTAQWVPHPTWVKVDIAKIPKEYLTSAAEAIQAQLGLRGIEMVGGKSWWQWRPSGSEVRAEWIEMKSDHIERKKNKDPGKRVMFYVHGGAYFFGSVDMHRYQLQRHARKLRARVFARYEPITEYRLAPQFPFPCGLQDCLAAYLYLLTVQDPTTVVFAGDSAGGGMIVSLLIILRDRGLPLPAGAILISPWVDLTHSFPSVSADSSLDYIPANGFHQRPSASWPPPNSDDMLAINEAMSKKLNSKEHVSQAKEEDAVQGFHVKSHANESTSNDNAAIDTATPKITMPIDANPVPGLGRELSIMIDGKLIEIKDQIQMYASNQLISHPLVSPVLQPSLGGLPPLLILTGGGEMLRDEQIYLAHKAAHPAKYPPGDAVLDENPDDRKRDELARWKPTDVQLQVWDDLCHVAPTLSFTRPAKYMYRSIAQFGAWALARAQKTEIEILDDDNVSIISDSENEDAGATKEDEKPELKSSSGSIGRAGDPLPPFKNHMIRQRVDLHGDIFPLDSPTSLPGCKLPPSEIGVIKEGPVRKWMASKLEWDTKFASSKRRVQKQRAREIVRGYETFGDGEMPPPSAVAGRRQMTSQESGGRRKKSVGLSMWSGWGSKHDKDTMDRELQADQEPQTIVTSAADGANARPLDDTEIGRGEETSRRNLSTGGYSRSRSRRRTVTDEHQTDGPCGDDQRSPDVTVTSSQQPSLFGPAAIASASAAEKLKEERLAPKASCAVAASPKGAAAAPVMAGKEMEVPLNVAANRLEGDRAARIIGQPPAASLQGPIERPARAKLTQGTVPEKSAHAPDVHAPSLEIAGDNSKHTLTDTTSKFPSEKTTIMANEIIKEISEKPSGAAVEKATLKIVDADTSTETAATAIPTTASAEHATETIVNDVSEKASTAAPVLTSASVLTDAEVSTAAPALEAALVSTAAPALEAALVSTAAPALETAPVSKAAPVSEAAPVSMAAPVSTATPVPKVDSKASNAAAPKTKGRTFNFSFRRKSTMDATKRKVSAVEAPSAPAATAEGSGLRRKSAMDAAKQKEKAVEAPAAPVAKAEGAGMRRRSIMDFALMLKGSSTPAPKLPEKAKPAEKVEEKAVPAAKVEEKAKQLASLPKVPIQAPTIPSTETPKEPAKPAPAAKASPPPIPKVVEPTPSKKKSISDSGDITLPETSQSTRPKSRGVAFPFSLKRNTVKGKSSPASSASVTTITSASNIPPAKPVQTKAAGKDATVKAATSEAVKEATAKSNGVTQRIVQNGGVTSTSKSLANPAATALEAQLPVPKIVNSDSGSISSANKDVDDYLTW